jgi:hypothetical protein
MRFFEKIQKLDIFWKKFIVFVVIVAVAVPLGFLVGKNFQKRTKEFKKEEFLEKLGFPEIKEEIEKTPFEELKETGKKLEEEFKKLEEMAEQMTTSSTSTNFQ